MSSESTPILSRAISYFEVFMTQLEELGREHELLEPWTKTGLDWATKYYKRMDDTDVYVVTMCEFLERYIAAERSAANLNLQFSILLYASRGSKLIGNLTTSRTRRI
jgi:hypothetical protein